MFPSHGGEGGHGTLATAVSYLRCAGRSVRLAACLAALVAGAVAASCGPVIDPTGAFATDVHPVLTSRCTPCHNGDQSISERGPGAFATPDASAAYTSLQVYVVPGDADASALMLRLTREPFMPPAPAQPLADVSAIAAWIDDGAEP